MPFNFLKKQKDEAKNKDEKMNVVIISAACCVPGMDAFDSQARRVIDRAISETGIDAKVTLVPATTAMFAFNKVIGELMIMQGNGKLGVPAILIEGEVVSCGVPQIEDIKAALKKFSDLRSAEPLLQLRQHSSRLQEGKLQILDSFNEQTIRKFISG